MGSQRSLAKEFHKLMRSIKSFSGGQARVVNFDEENLGEFDVEIAPSDGLYKHGKFIFKFTVDDSYDACPVIHCLTEIYHPNIDPTVYETDCNNVCVSLLDDWQDNNDLEDCVQALLFLLYNPNTEDPLSPYFSPGITEEEFEDNVRLSLEGGTVDDFIFETNIGYIENGILKKDTDADCCQNKNSPNSNAEANGPHQPILTELDRCQNTPNSNAEAKELPQPIPTEQDVSDNTSVTSVDDLIMTGDAKKANFADQQKQFAVKDDSHFSDKSKFRSIFFDNLVPLNTLASVMLGQLLQKFDGS